MAIKTLLPRFFLLTYTYSGFKQISFLRTINQQNNVVLSLLLLTKFGEGVVVTLWGIFPRDIGRSTNVFTTIHQFRMRNREFHAEVSKLL